LRGRNSRSNPAVGEIASLALAKTPMLNCSVLSFFGFLVLSSLRLFGAILAAAAFAVFHPAGVEFAADDVIAHARQVFDPAAADEHDRVFLEIVPDSRNVGDDFVSVGQPHLGDLADGGVRFLRRGGIDLDAHAALERRTFGQGHWPVVDEVPSTL